MAPLVMIAAVAMIADVASGFAGAVKAGTLRSGKMREGLWHKAGFCGLIAMGFLVECAAGLADIGVTVPAASAVCVWVIATEAISILENLSAISPQIAESPLAKAFGRPTRPADERKGEN